MSFLTIRTVTLPAATSTLVAGAVDRQHLKIINIGVNPATLNFDAAAVAGSGWPLAAADVAGGQGGGIDFPSPPSNAIHAISTSGTTLCVMEG